MIGVPLLLQGIVNVAFWPVAASRISTIQSVSITGGEPFLLQEKVSALVTFARELGFWSEVVTNSFWADSYEIAKQTLAAVQFEDGDFYRPLAAIYKKNKVLSPAMKQFLTILKDGH